MATHETSIRSESSTNNPSVQRTDVDRSVRPSPFSMIRNIVYVIFVALESLLLIRFLLSLFGANRTNTFANFIYNVTAPFVAPFRGLFGVNTVLGNGLGRFEYETVIAMIVYALLAMVLMMALRASDREDV